MAAITEPGPGSLRQLAEALVEDRWQPALTVREWWAALSDAGLAQPTWPEGFGGCGATPAEARAVAAVLGAAGTIAAPAGGIAALLAAPTLLEHGTLEQRARFVPAIARGEEAWCQLFSEPGAGSDAAAIQTRAKREPGGWRVNGQKVWTSDARNANRGLATVRTNPDAPKHAGVSTFVIDMSAPGVDVRPLRELTGETLFNEVFFDDVFVPDADVVGDIDAGWTVARATLGNERVSIGGNKGGLDLVGAGDLALLETPARPLDTGAAREVGVVMAEERAMAALNLRHVARTLAGGPPGAEGNVTKLLSAEHAQRVAGVGMRIAGLDAVAGGEAKLTHSYLFSRCLTIAGGTSEIVRNLIAERILGLPREQVR